jgi:outer membrane biosynthesis protein TonB
LVPACRGELSHSSTTPAPTVSHAATAPSPALEPTAIPTPYRVGDGVTAPRLKKRAEFTIPEVCKKSEYEGVFIFEATITEAGRVTDLHTIRSPKLTPACPELERACRNAISTWTYDPAIRDGKPVSVYLAITVRLHSW